MRIEIVRDFLPVDECAELNEWVRQGVANGWLANGIGNRAVDVRLTTRLYAERFEYPQLVRDISERVRTFCGVAAYPLISGHGRDGVVVSCTFPGGDVYPHRDPPAADGTQTLRCNILTNAADAGAEIYVDGQLVDARVGDLHCYLVSEHTHYVTAVEGASPRVLWMFGAHVPAEDWNGGKIKVGN